MNRGPSLKRNNSISRGFTLIEVLVSIVILSVIAVITFNFLQSSIQSKEIVFRKSHEILQLNLLSNTLQEDFINAVNTPLKNFRGEPERGTLIGGVNANSFSFVTKAASKYKTSKSLVRVQYLLENNSFLRRQYYAAAPSNPNEYIETVLSNNIKDFNLEFADNANWYYFWPQGDLTVRKIPTLIKVSIRNNQNQSFTWIIKPNLPNAYE